MEAVKDIREAFISDFQGLQGSHAGQELAANRYDRDLAFLADILRWCGRDVI